MIEGSGSRAGRIRIHTSDLWIRIREAQKHVDPVDPDSDPDPEHWGEATNSSMGDGWHIFFLVIYQLLFSAMCVCVFM
jgi:hypothetical protein